MVNDLATFDVSKKFVRVTEVLASGMVEFEFSVGEPEMAVELIFPKLAFEEFCRSNQVTFLTDSATPNEIDTADSAWAWRLRTATHQRFRT